MDRTLARPADLGRLKDIRKHVLGFYRTSRRDLPWRHTRDPYRILVSEVMLQQTQADRVVPKYRQFLERFPTVKHLARARFASVLRVWIGLGYNGRALRLWQCAKLIVRNHNGVVPSKPRLLGELPGIGPYTAAAVASFAFGARLPVIDTNVRRVLSRAVEGRDSASSVRAATLAEAALVCGDAAVWAQALMDVGALFCRSRPRCERCPVRPCCKYANFLRVTAKSSGSRATTTPFAGSNRFYRGRIVRVLSERRSVAISNLGRQVRENFSARHRAWLDGLLQQLSRDGLIVIDRKRKRVQLP